MNPGLILLIIIIIGILLIPFGLARAFRNLSLRVKVTTGILATGGIALGFLAIYSINATTLITDSLSGRLETGVKLLAEEQLINTATSETGEANAIFEKIESDIVELAAHWSALQEEQASLSLNSYWDANTRLTQLEGGQYGNSPTDVSSVYVPAGVSLDETLLGELNTSAYLDFSAPAILESNASILAVYGIDTKGTTRYYPNINLASILPPDFDPTERPYYKITSPLFNTTRSARWAIPYVDAAGGGLVVTVTAPVYMGDEFKGIIAADMKLADITTRIEGIRIGQIGFAFMIDDAGRIISMTDAGYELFGINPGSINTEEYFKQTVLGLGPDELVEATNRMVAGGSGLVVVPANGRDFYLAFAPIKANGYSVGVAVPVAELQVAIITARNETQSQIQSTATVAVAILAILFLVSFVTSLGIGRIIAAPIVRLTQTANNIVAGDLASQAESTTRDEIGLLAQAFNTMTSRLRETLAGLEQRVTDRTSELIAANKRNEARARQFESIARVARTIGSTQDLDALLPQITTVISRQFGFYHVGIFLTDSRKEYAILSAANSEGGQRMLAINHKLKIGETGIVGYVCKVGKPRVALDTGADAVYFDNPLLPNTHSEIALPLFASSEIIGALDVQSTEVNAFGEDDINALSILADQVSVAIQNARQYEQTQKALAESEALSRQLAGANWQDFTQRRKLVGIRHSGARATLLYAGNGKDGKSAIPMDDPARSKSRGGSLSLPITMRGEPIGSVEVRASSNHQWDKDELDIVSAIIERAALALENARFFEESQKRAAKERTIGEIAAKISAQSRIDELLKTAVQELSRTLPGAEIAIQFRKDQDLE